RLQAVRSSEGVSAVQLQRAPAAAPAPEDLARADLYALVASLMFAAPARDLLDAIGGARLLGEDAEGELRDAWQSLQSACRAADAGAVRQEFDDLFVGVGHPLVQPNASYYLAGFLNEAPLVELRERLAELGFGRRPAVGETEDHLSALADVMRMLILGTGDGAGSELKAQRRFFERFLKPWYARLAQDLAAAERADFYGVVGRFLKAFLDVETASFEMA
ncbi:MAG TPA: molecular chaperone TorD family protein, partial [Burkholderiales bacterium]|nr:molecular chaperone TorD family protein [Burkholderiales bacterium]